MINFSRSLFRQSSLKCSFKRGLSLALVMTFFVTAFSHDADARRRRRRVKKKRAPIINEKKLYERLGGAKSVAEITDEWVRMNLADSRVAASFSPAAAKPDVLAKWRKNINEQICEWSDGPCKAKTIEGDLKKAQVSLAADDTQFYAFADNLYRSLQKFNISEREKNELLGRFGDYRETLLPEDDSAPKE